MFVSCCNNTEKIGFHDTLFFDSFQKPKIKKQKDGSGVFGVIKAVFSPSELLGLVMTPFALNKRHTVDTKKRLELQSAIQPDITTTRKTQKNAKTPRISGNFGQITQEKETFDGQSSICTLI